MRESQAKSAHSVPAPAPDEESNTEQVVNFMSKFRDKDTRVLKNLNSTQFIEVWNNYDKDGELIIVPAWRASGAGAAISGPASSARHRSGQWARVRAGRGRAPRAGTIFITLAPVAGAHFAT